METSSSDDIDDDVILFKCRLCPDKTFTATEKNLHRLAHQKPMNGPQETQENSNQSAPLNLELPLVFPGGQRGKVKLAIVVTLENGTPNLQVNAEAPILSKPKPASTRNGTKTAKSKKQPSYSGKKQRSSKKCAGKTGTPRSRAPRTFSPSNSRHDL